MSRYIDAERLYTELEQLYKDNGWERMEAHFSLSDMECNIHFMPTANVRENVTGKWEEVDDIWDDNVYRCSACGGMFNVIEGTPQDNDMKYCPYCGARMMETKEE